MRKVVYFIFLCGIGVGLILSSSFNLLLAPKGDQNDGINALSAMETSGEIETIAALEQIKSDVSGKDESQQIPKKDEENIILLIREDHTSEQIADLLYENQLIMYKEDFKILLNLKTLDVYEAGQVLTDKGLISRGWKINQLLGLLAKKYDQVSNILQEKSLIDDKESADYILGGLKETPQIIPGEKTIKKGTSMHEIIEILTH